MYALVLAAGRGARLRPVTDTLPKCLLRFGGEPLLFRHFDGLRRAGVARCGVVVGHREGAVERAVSRYPAPGELQVELLRNPDYRRGSALSVLRGAARLTDEGGILTDADVLMPPDFFSLVAGDGSSARLLLDRRYRADGEEVLVRLDSAGRVERLSKGLDPVDVAGESVGAFYLPPAEASVFLEAAAEASATDPDVEYEPVLDSILESIELGAVDVTGRPWIEIDSRGDLATAEGDVWPRIRAEEERGPPAAGTSPPRS